MSREKILIHQGNFYDFEVTSDEGSFKLTALTKEATETIRLIFLKNLPQKYKAEINFIRLCSTELEHTLRTLIAEGYQVNFKKEK